ncbi:hypothetical protein FHT80_002087 [Rhizobium sp. BK226]|uniref:caspase family protein n=1 Tax=Rhizobium sp. BK226 TaxID=2587075 RepID=UPI00161ACF99|nr:caspase family protein [Rhizobium sp. BK226]MBB4112768.1 hypothetical protein [Rhizobium sp. BK226]
MASRTQALIIGNGAYEGDLRLDSPPKDATSIAACFDDLGIEYDLVLDATFEQAKEAVKSFLERVARPTTEVSVLYYSGHGMQLKETNYIVPVDYDTASPETASLISVQSILDTMTDKSSIRIVFMDACRNNPDAQQVVLGKGIRYDVGKEFKLDGNIVPLSGLAEIKTKSNTFIAFAAAPGDVAYDGSVAGGLSPFTASLVRYLDVVDLPLSNLTSRVRQEVLASTDNRQRTWDQSSLMAPFYFNPGSLLLFAGNFMALIGLVISLTVYTLYLIDCWWCFPRSHLFAAMALPAITLTILLFGVQNVYSRLRGRFEGAKTVRTFMARLLLTSAQKGLLGGALGSLVAAPVLSTLYYAGWQNPVVPLGELMLEITYGTAFAACPLGLLAVLFAGVARQKAVGTTYSQHWTFLGGSLGGLLAGALTAPFLTAFFGLMHDRPPMTPVLLLPGSIVGAAFLVLAIVNFDFERLSRRRVWASVASSVVSLVIGLAVALIVFTPLYFLGVVESVQNYLETHSEEPLPLMKGGFIYGLPVGFVLGAVIASAILLTEKWSRKTLLA